MNVTFQIEKVRDAWPELFALARMHWHETENYRADQGFAPDLSRYEYYEEIGFYILYTARAGTRLIGNLGMYYIESMHTQQLIATEDTLFLHPEFRRGRIAMHLIKFMVEDMRKRGVVEIAVTAKNPRVGRLLEFLDFKPVASQYSLAVAPTARMVPTIPVGVSHDATSAERANSPDLSAA